MNRLSITLLTALLSTAANAQIRNELHCTEEAITIKASFSSFRKISAAQIGNWQPANKQTQAFKFTDATSSELAFNIKQAGSSFLTDPIADRLAPQTLFPYPGRPMDSTQKLNYLLPVTINPYGNTLNGIIVPVSLVVRPLTGNYWNNIAAGK